MGKVTFGFIKIEPDHTRKIIEPFLINTVGKIITHVSMTYFSVPED